MWSPRRAGATLAEVLVVVAVVGVLIGLTVSAVQQVRAAAGRSGCQNSLRQVSLGLHAFHAAHGRLPPWPAATPDVVLGWMAVILPQVGEEPLYQAAELARRADPRPLNNPPHAGLAAVVRAFTCPADGRLSAPGTDAVGTTAGYPSFVGIAGAFVGAERVARAGMLGPGPGVRLSDAADGTSTTLRLGERPPPGNFQAGWWYPGLYADGEGRRGPNHHLYLNGGLLFAGDPCLLSGRAIGPGRLDNPCDRFHLWSLHPGGANLAFADGGVRFARFSAGPLLPALASRAGGEPGVLPE
jgi:prepilin-type processing-associated H-X9-DG protein